MLRLIPLRFSPRKSQGRTSPITLALLLVLLWSAPHSLAQIAPPGPPPLAKTQAVATVDPLGRETPRRAAINLLKYEEREDFGTASRFLEPTPDPGTNLVERAKELHALGRRFRGSIGTLSDDPQGAVQTGLPPGQMRAGVVAVGDTTLDVILVRVDDPEFGKIWLVSQETVARVPDLYAKMQSEAPTAFVRVMPAAVTTRRLLGMSLAQWLGWLFSIPLSGFFAWLLSLLLSAPERLWYKLRRLPSRTIWDTGLGMPLKWIIGILIHCFMVYALNPILLYRVFYFRFMAALLVACFAWLVSRIIDRGFDSAVNRTRTQRAGGESILILMQRMTRVLMLVIAIVAALALFGINVTTTLAGLGIGGLAIALAAQKTFENILGGISLLMDEAVHVGDFCAIGGKFGTVEDVGLRSLKLRTLDQNLLVVPNGALAQMQFENMKARPKLLLNQTFSLRIETPVQQLRSVLDRVQNMLNQHPSIESGNSRIRVNDFAGASFELELFAYAKTGDWGEFTLIRQDVILKIAEIVEGAGARFAGPTRVTYLSREQGSEEEKARGVGAS